jgi:hypothetical protein
LYGSELWALKPKHLDQLEKFQLKKLRCIQNLPDRTANAAVLGLLGIRPVEAELHIRVLGLFRNAIDSEQNIEHQIACRQLAMKNQNSNSWFIYVDSILQLYELPSAHDLIEHQVDKEKWKHQVKEVITAHWERKLLKEAKSSIRYICKESLKLDKPALLWTSSLSSPRESQKARIKAKLLCGSMRLQVHDSLYSGGKVSPTCVLCGTEAENRLHFLLRCPATEEIRTFHIARVQALLADYLKWDCVTPEGLMQLLLDPIDLLASGDWLDMVSREKVGDGLERISRNMILQMSRRRLELLNLPPRPQPAKKTTQAKKTSQAKKTTQARRTRRKHTTSEG